MFNILIQSIPDIFDVDFTQNPIINQSFTNSIGKIPDKINETKTKEAWGDTRNTYITNRKIQSIIENRYMFEFNSSQSLNYNNIRLGDVVTVFPINEDAFDIYNIDIKEEQIDNTRTWHYTIEFTKANEFNIVNYLSSDNVKKWADLSSGNIVNELSFEIKKPQYIQRVAMVYNTVPAKHNFIFSVNEITDNINVGDVFSLHSNHVDWSFYSEVAECTYKTATELYFKIGTGETLYITDYSYSEIILDIEGAPDTITLIYSSIDFSLYTFIQPKKVIEISKNDSNEQVSGVQTFGKIQSYDAIRFLIYVKEIENYKVKYLSFAKKENIVFKTNINGTDVLYYPVTDGYLTVNRKEELIDLMELDFNLKYNNLIVNGNR